jgi:hypothetical protein
MKFLTRDPVDEITLTENLQILNKLFALHCLCIAIKADGP